MELIRIQKFLSDAGVCSRRHAEEEIESGNVYINGLKAKIGDKIDPRQDYVLFNGKHVKIKHNKHHIYVMLNKPVGYVTTMSDDKGRKTVSDLVSDIKSRIYPVGRLDMDSEGLLLMTDDGDLTNILTHPRHNIPKIYKVFILEQINKKTIEELESIDILDDIVIKNVHCELEKSSEKGSIIKMILYEGKNRQIRKMCEKCNLTVKRLQRIAIGDLDLDIPKGKWRYLNKNEVDYLKDISSKEEL